jgi:acetoin utilization deacetylase AcuC-like enzyme
VERRLASLDAGWLEVAARPATTDELLRVHTSAHLQRLARAAREGASLDADTYTTASSLEAAQAAAGVGLSLVRRVLGGEARRGVALVRPPGHHAEPDRAMGFCLVNHAAVMARAAQTVTRLDGGTVAKVAVLDFDVHHGNGTQAAFETDPSVLYVSMHQFPLYPGTGWFTERGRDGGFGTVANVPLPAGTGDAGHLAAFDVLVAPLVREFEPDLVILSAGFDAHWRDPLAGQLMTVRGFRMLSLRVAELAEELCGGRVVATLEGGYPALTRWERHHGRRAA